MSRVSGKWVSTKTVRNVTLQYLIHTSASLPDGYRLSKYSEDCDARGYNSSSTVLYFLEATFTLKTKMKENCKLMLVPISNSLSLDYCFKVNKYIQKVEEITIIMKGTVNIRQNGSAFIEQLENFKCKQDIACYVVLRILPLVHL